MYDIKPLEEKWKKYRNKQRRPWYMFFFLVLISIGVIFTFFNYKEFFVAKFNALSTKEIIFIKPSTVLLHDALVTLEINKAKVIKEIKVNASAEKNASPLPLGIVEDIPVLEDVQNRKKYPKEKVDKPRKKIHINIIETLNQSAYKDVAKRFKQSHDTDDSLFLAKSYYKKSYYKKAVYWALQTNKVNRNIDESWIIFAKSKANLGHKNEAIRILTSYVKRVNSSRAKHLLKKLQNNN